ncbi:MAG: hypothetical protein ABSG82_05820 [Sedimentisphaerales bacterium]
MSRKVCLRRAVTIMELVIAVAMIAIIFAAILPQFAIIRDSWDVKQGSSEALQNGRVLMDHISRNLSKAKRITVVSDSSVTDGYIQFVDNNDVNNRYDIASADSYVEYGPIDNLSDLAGPVTSLKFTCYDACDLNTPLSPVTDVNIIRVVKVDATITNSASMGQAKSFTTWVYLRTNSSSQTALTKGTAFEFDATSGLYTVLVKIDATHYLCAYSRGSSCYAVVLNVDPNTWAITKYTPRLLDAYGILPALVKIDSTSYLCAYMASSGPPTGYAVVLTVNTSTWAITAGNVYMYSTPLGVSPALAQIDTTHCLCACFRTSGSFTGGYAGVLTVSGTTITPGTFYQYDGTSGAGQYPALAQIDATHYLCAYMRGGPLGYAVVLTVNTSTWAITAGTSYSLETPAASGQYHDLAQIDSTHYLCAYTGASNRGYAVVLTVSGTTITAGTRYQFDGTNGLYPALVQIDSTRYLCAYAGPSNHGKAVVLTVQPNTWDIATETSFEFDTSNGQYPALAQIDAGNYLCAYTGPSSHGRSVPLCILKP